MRCSRAVRMTLLAICAAAGAGLAAPWWYRRHVESEFVAFITPFDHRETVSILESRCVGKTVSSIRLLPIAESKLFGSYPYLCDIEAPRERSYMESAYWHGYWFNYCKRLVRCGEELTAYWSLQEDRWHLVRLRSGPRGWEEGLSCSFSGSRRELRTPV